jgi:HAE1 family hydrophobic/amphiphilic exporter-1
LRAFAIQPNSLGIRGAGNGLQFAFVGNSYDELAEVGQQMVEKLEQDPRFRRSGFPTRPPSRRSPSRSTAPRVGSWRQHRRAGEALQALLDGGKWRRCSSRTARIPVKLLSTNNPINDPTDLESIYLKAGDGRIVPMSTIATLTEKAVAPDLSAVKARCARFPSPRACPGICPGGRLGGSGRHG